MDATTDASVTKPDDGQPGPSRMMAWQINSYSSFEESAKLNTEASSPAAAVGPKEVLVRVKATSVNPIDVLMAGECVTYTYVMP